jgi:hypothetical protein
MEVSADRIRRAYGPRILRTWIMGDSFTLLLLAMLAGRRQILSNR